MERQQIRAMSFNLHENDKITTRAVFYVNDDGTDFLCLQEANRRVSYHFSDCSKPGSEFNRLKGVPNLSYICHHGMAIVAKRTYLPVASVPLPTNCLNMMAGLYVGPNNIHVGVINVYLERRDGNLDILDSNIFPSLMSVIHSLRYGFRDPLGKMTPPANVIIFGGDGNAINEDLVDLDEVREARPALREPYFTKSQKLHLLTSLFNIGTNVPASRMNWTRGYYIFKHKKFYQRRPGGGVELDLEYLREQFEAFLRWRYEHGFNANLLHTAPSFDERKALFELFGFGKANSLPCFKFLYQHFLANNRTFTGLTLDHFFTLKQPSWIDYLLFSNNCRILHYAYPRHVIDFWPRKSDHRPIEAIIEVVRDYADELTGVPAADRIINEFRGMIGETSDQKVVRFNRLLSNEAALLRLNAQLNVQMPPLPAFPINPLLI